MSLEEGWLGHGTYRLNLENTENSFSGLNQVYTPQVFEILLHMDGELFIRKNS